MNTILAMITEMDASSWILIFSLGLLFFAFSGLRRQQQQTRANTERLQRTQNDLRALISASLGMGERMLEVERRQRRLAERQEQLDIYDAANQPYEQAIRMAQNGSKTDELVDICGLSETEAELIKIMHRLDKAG
ncbi:hypothetical protein MNBD_GAMMA24-1519 [hydrothermal vent metagenome]|uniref:DUF2802 domain-containing protein n=1 Tax=hydrothermal vent metagenome TaxID=652676 RepID=A0A3B1BSX5_9ZZZZ